MRRWKTIKTKLRDESESTQIAAKPRSLYPIPPLDPRDTIKFVVNQETAAVQMDRGDGSWPGSIILKRSNA